MRPLGKGDAPRHRAPDCRGVSLVELLVALTLFGIVGTAILGALDRQVRLHTTVLALLESRTQHAATHEILGVSLRGVAPLAGDVQAVSDSAIVFRLSLGGGVVCATGASRVMLAPDTLGNGQVLTRMHSAPQRGDTLWLLDEGPTDATIDDQWLALSVWTAMRATGGCAGGGLIAPPDDALPAWRIDVATVLPPTITAGVPARLTRRARFSLYRSGSDSWLGFAEWNAAGTGWNTIQPVSGPYLPYSSASPAASGVALAPRDSSGGSGWGRPTASVTALSVATRTRTRVPLRLDGMQRGFALDSLRSLLAMRNAR